MGAVYIFICSLLLNFVLCIEFDGYYPNKKVKKIAFGSCNNLRFRFDYWQSIIDAHPDIWLWTGDIVYGKTKHGTDLSNVRNDYNKLKSHPLYQEFISNGVIIEGVYDDHDIGMNDADIRLSKPIQQEAQELLLDFLDVDATNSRRNRDGVYSVHKYSDTMVILLDTRTHRSPTVIPSIGKYEFPFFAFIASYIRYLTAYFGFVDNYEGDVLGEKQWSWFQEILKSDEYKSSNLVLIVSSTQIFTSNPYFESWGHFPKEKTKLIQLLYDSIPDNNSDQHVLFISGDVHHAELIYGNEEYGPIEVTTSGLTHSLGKMDRLFGIERVFSTHITDTYKSHHRTKFNDYNVKNSYYGRNFGVVEISEKKQYKLKIRDPYSREDVISVPLNSHKKSTLKYVLQELQHASRVYFPRKYPFFGLEILPICLLVVICLYGLYRLINRKKQPKDHHN